MTISECQAIALKRILLRVNRLAASNQRTITLAEAAATLELSIPQVRALLGEGVLLGWPDGSVSAISVRRLALTWMD